MTVPNAAVVNCVAGNNMSQQAKRPSTPTISRRQGVPVYVMLPLDTVSYTHKHMDLHIPCVQPG